MLCIYVEYCVTSRAGKCLETCNTDKPRFDDFAGRPVRVRAAGFTGSISSLCPSEIPLARPDTAIEIFRRKKYPPTLLSPRGREQLFSRSTFYLDHLLWTTFLEIPCCKNVQLLFRWKLVCIFFYIFITFFFIHLSH